MLRRDDPLELLLPEADARDLRRARDVTHFLRLLSNDAGALRASSVLVDFERARGELARVDRERIERAHVDLLRHFLRALVPLESFAWFGEPALEPSAAWRVIDEARDEIDALAGVPAPGENAETVAERLVESLVRAGASEHSVALWRARLAHAASGPREGERLYRAEIARAAASAPTGIVRALVAGVAEALLDRGAVREARSWLYEHLALTGSDVRLRQLLAWARLCAGDAAGARSVLVGSRPWSGPLPAALLDLRAARPEWMPCLAGRTPRAGECPRCFIDPSDRSSFGAAVLAVFEFRPRGGARLVFHDCAPALRARVRAWTDQRDGVWAVAGEREHRVVVEARALVEHVSDPADLRGALDRGLARAVALTPFFESDGEVAGWVHLEFEHHLVPSSTVLARVAAVWRTRVVRQSGPDEDRATVPADSSAREDLQDLELENGPLAGAFHDLVRSLGWKTIVRRWVGFGVHGGNAVEVAAGGEGQGFHLEARGKRRALERAVATGGRVAFDEPDARLSIHAEAGSGVVFPLRLDGRVVGLFAVESSRRRDFRPVDLDAAAPRIDDAAWALRLAQMRAWHGRRFGFDPWFDPARADLRAFGRTLRAAARSHAAVLLHGPAGAGKLVVARWLHFESAAAEGAFKVVACGARSGGGSLQRLIAGAEGGTVVLDDVGELSIDAQEALLRQLEGGDLAHDTERARVRWIATTREPLEQCAATGRLRADLARLLDRIALAVPPLASRREDIPPLVEHLARRFSAEERSPRIELSDEASACLWRQTWAGNVRELEAVVYKLALLYPGLEIGLAELAELRRGFGLVLERRLPSRHPKREDLIAALRTTRKLAGRVNKTRAALYLGWDPDTLVARMHDAHLSDEAIPEARGWYALDGDEPLVARGEEADDETA